IMTTRLYCACPISPRQRGFTCAAGCSENLKLLQLLVKHSKKERCALGAVFVDIAKAFDTVCHEHILSGLSQRGVDPHIIHLVGDMYKNITTYIN
ncbi:POLR protein, partial [Dasyornis broadbenti]|nr:POLR protein [Dasyornis broadbenti]